MHQTSIKPIPFFCYYNNVNCYEMDHLSSNYNSHRFLYTRESHCLHSVLDPPPKPQTLQHARCKYLQPGFLAWKSEAKKIGFQESGRASKAVLPGFWVQLIGQLGESRYETLWKPSKGLCTFICGFSRELNLFAGLLCGGKMMQMERMQLVLDADGDIGALVSHRHCVSENGAIV